MKLSVNLYPSRENWASICRRPTIDHSSLEASVGSILKEVQENGDEAVRRFSLMFDKTAAAEFEITPAEISAAVTLVSADLKEAIQTAKVNIEKFHALQIIPEQVVETMPGVKCWRRSVPVEKVGLYIPGGSAPLFSTILMLAIPATLAGCQEIVLCSPPDQEGKLHPAILYAAEITGVKKIYKIGGVQAIAAMAFGTDTVPKVNKIFGPGNQYVTCAKQMIQEYGVAIDMPAGPSEVAVFADDTADADFVAADLLSQAEHGADSQVLLVTTSEIFAEKTMAALDEQLGNLPRRDIASKALENSRIVVVENSSIAMALLNEYSPEHLILACENAEELSLQVINAGSVFLGNYSPESAGDYASGTNHTLPTNGNARAYSGVSVDSFMKKITFQQISSKGIQNLGSTVEILAEAEGLHAHKHAVSIRLSKLTT